VLPVIKAISPKTYRWIVGGSDYIEVEEDQDVPVSETIWHDEVQMVNGVAKLVKNARSEEVPVRDFLPVFDADGNAVTREVQIKEQTGVDEQGKPIIITRTEIHPVLHTVVRTERKRIKVKRRVDREGRRIHWGFLAQDVKAAFDGINMDFGGYVKSEDGTENLRPDQLIPVLWKAVQELSAEFEAYKAAHP
jgi:hypothetical protein